MKVNKNYLKIISSEPEGFFDWKKNCIYIGIVIGMKSEEEELEEEEKQDDNGVKKWNSNTGCVQLDDEKTHASRLWTATYIQNPI